MNDKKIADYDPSLDMFNPNRSYMDKYPDYDPSLDIFNPNKSYMDKYPDWAPAAEINSEMRAAQAEEPIKLTEDEYLQRKLAEATAPMAAEINPEMRVANPDGGIHRSK